MAWHEQPIIFYDWVRHGEELTPEYARWVVQKTRDLHADTLAFCVQAGGYALWNSQVTPRAPQIGQMDLIGEMAHLCKECGLRFVPWWLGTAGGVERILREHPSWQLVGPPGKEEGQKKNWYICYNTPYRELLYEEVREVIDQYEVDGIYFDQLPGSCYCVWCQKKFERLYGQAMPTVADEFFVYNSAAGLPAQLREFRDQAVVSFCQGMRKVIDETRPGVVYAQNWVRNQQAYLANGLVDVLLPEFYQRDDAGGDPARGGGSGVFGHVRGFHRGGRGDGAVETVDPQGAQRQTDAGERCARRTCSLAGFIRERALMEIDVYPRRDSCRAVSC